MGLLLALTNLSSSTLFSDHLNSVHLIEDLRSKVGQENKLRSMNGRFYYRWIADIISNSGTSVIHTKSHTNEMSLVSLLNGEADHYASQAQGTTYLISTAPIPTFCMDDFTFYWDSDGWVESNICMFTDYFMVRQTAISLYHAHHHHMNAQLYDLQSPLPHLYTRASLAYSTLVQLYAHSGQLLTASCMKQRGQSASGLCRYRCGATEDMHHVFIECARFKLLRSEASELILKKVDKRMEEFEVHKSHGGKLIKIAKLFFLDSNVIWPLHASTFYLGYVPKLDHEVFANSTRRTHFLSNMHNDLHLAGICLASHIWGAVQRDMAKRREGLALVERVC
jgi:hypothetical protein